MKKSLGDLGGEELIDRYTAAHYAFGVVMGAGRVPFWAAALAAVGWEIIERPLKRQLPSLFPQAVQDTPSNMIGDVLAMLAGWTTWKVIDR